MRILSITLPYLGNAAKSSADRALSGMLPPAAMGIGIFAGLAAGAFWGLSFVAPLLVAPYTAFDVTIGRYIVFALSSAAILLISGRNAGDALGPRGWRIALWLGLMGYVVYYLLLAFAVQAVGPALPALVVGSLPVLLAAYGNWRQKTIAWRLLAMPLAAIALGLFLVNFEAARAGPDSNNLAQLALGCALAIGATLVWMWYAIANAAALAERPTMGAATWAALTGLGAGAGTLLIAVPGFALGLSSIPQLGLWRSEAVPLVLWSLATGLLSSWLATYLWSLAAQRLSVALSAQLIVSETLFALLFGFLLAARWPSAFEAAGAALLVAGVMVGTHSFHKSGKR
jgi:drug/metabolite transporter (DMT)-like permease